MTSAICLGAYGLLVAVGAPRLLRRSALAERAPRLGVALWLGAALSVLLAWLAAAAMAGVHALVASGAWEPVARDCLAGGHAAACLGAIPASWHAGSVGVLWAAVAAAGFGVFGYLSVSVGRAMHQVRRARGKHVAAVRVVGRPAPALGEDTIVLDTGDRAAYCVAGRRDTVVVTTGALESLSQAELAAVLAHERAHLTGRHHLLLSLMKALGRTFSWLPLFPAAEREVARLCEMRADDAAARSHGEATLVGALLAMSEGKQGRHPSVALGASGYDVLARANRLLAPCGTGPESRRGALRRRMVAVACMVAVAGTTVTVGACTVLPLA
ncbi:M56 family metallopeptidase [Haloechinothrix sp. LS1_15]|uniref:M56 family metallopeptidase n=1 Tax=Haloechinothrix sp. LS1_15 TaxID=2652248 RepID=UPI00294538E2|nr:M56 family metallopeptidase [Haloechinothrix sp. LS1_15]MDV6014290.1 M56 family metallopeptidase [Haloechinothrix sp. LS1_15]